MSQCGGHPSSKAFALWAVVMIVPMMMAMRMGMYHLEGSCLSKRAAAHKFVEQKADNDRYSEGKSHP
ncbi:hypothetical protein D3C77_682910 [compost metagenome]